ncbi:MAG: GWxTD domain-containing protein [Balneolaceae bacterium]
MNRILQILFILPFLFVSAAEGQRNVSYQNLLERAERPSLYTSLLSLPGTGNEPLFMVSFRMDYDLLPFRRGRTDQATPDEEAGYYSEARINMEVFRENDSTGPGSVTRSSWADTIRTDTYEQTRSRFDHLEGAIAVRLEEGEYRLLLDMNRDDVQRGTRQRNRRTGFSGPSEQLFEIPDFSTGEEEAMVLLASSSRESDGEYLVRLLNYGESALYGQDYQVMILLPRNQDTENFLLQVDQLPSGAGDDAEGEPLYRKRMGREDLLYTGGFSHAPDSKQPELLFNITGEGFPVIIADIPNSTFPNARFRLSVTADGRQEPLAAKIIDSRWIDMPVSLLNLDVAIDMLRFIVEDSRLRQLRSGSASERERRFREFWAERDPTPDTEFNELMTEYYSRIDHAYNSYTTPETPGFDSDQGRAYILYGSPLRIERQYPTDSPTREIWEYRDRTLVFEATSGFGDFRLVQDQ